MKKLIIYILLLCIAFCFAACVAVEQPVTDVEELKEQVNDDWKKMQKVDEGSISGFRYYGTDNGYHIVMFNYGVSMAVVRNKKVAGYTFQHCANHLMAYKNGKFMDLKTAYFLGRVSKEAIARAAELHAARKNATDE